MSANTWAAARGTVLDHPAAGNAWSLNDWKDVRNILVIRLDNIGDVILLSPALSAMKSSLPKAQITLMASPAGSQVVSLLPWVDDVIIWRAVWQDTSGQLSLDPARELALSTDLSARGFDAAVIFTSFSQSPYPPAYACYLAGIPIRLGHSAEFGGGILSHWALPPGREGHQAERNLSLLEKAGFPVKQRQLELHIPAAVERRAGELLQQAGIDPERPFILLAPGASAQARRYEPARFAQVATELVSETSLPVVIAGSAREEEILAPVLAEAGKGGIFSLVGQTSVPELAAIIRRSSLVIANNSASLHMADAFKRPMVITYAGSDYESQWRPRSAPAHLLRQYTECAPCHQFTCPYGQECLDISPREVVQASVELLQPMLQSQVELSGLVNFSG